MKKTCLITASLLAMTSPYSESYASALEKPTASAASQDMKILIERLKVALEAAKSNDDIKKYMIESDYKNDIANVEDVKRAKEIWDEAAKYFFPLQNAFIAVMSKAIESSSHPEKNKELDTFKSDMKTIWEVDELQSVRSLVEKYFAGSSDYHVVKYALELINDIPDQYADVPKNLEILKMLLARTDEQLRPNFSLKSWITDATVMPDFAKNTKEASATAVQILELIIGSKHPHMSVSDEEAFSIYRWAVYNSNGGSPEKPIPAETRPLYEEFAQSIADSGRIPFEKREERHKGGVRRS